MKLLLFLLSSIPFVSPVNWIFPWQPDPVIRPRVTRGPRPIVVTPTPPPSPVRCGPLSIPSDLSLHVAKELSEELARTADVAFERGDSLEEVQETMEIGNSLTLPYKTRVLYISHLLASMRNATIDDPLTFSARREVHRIQRWTRELEVLQLDPRVVLKESIAVPWEKIGEWKKANPEEMKSTVYQVIQRHLCK